MIIKLKGQPAVDPLVLRGHVKLLKVDLERRSRRYVSIIFITTHTAYLDGKFMPSPTVVEVRHETMVDQLNTRFEEAEISWMTRKVSII